MVSASSCPLEYQCYKLCNLKSVWVRAMDGLRRLDTALLLSPSSNAPKSLPAAQSTFTIHYNDKRHVSKTVDRKISSYKS